LIAVDTNILVYAHREEMPLHRKSLDRLTEMAENHIPWAIPVFCLTEFLRVVTHPKVFDPPSSIQDGLEAVGELVRSPSLVVLHPAERFWRLFDDIVRQSGARGNLVYDAQIAAVCLENGVNDLLSEDRDFTRFDGIALHTL
jgi:toxin-antitoxin system PIN domain toxin